MATQAPVDWGHCLSSPEHSDCEGEDEDSMLRMLRDDPSSSTYSPKLPWREAEPMALHPCVVKMLAISIQCALTTTDVVKAWKTNMSEAISVWSSPLTEAESEVLASSSPDKFTHLDTLGTGSFGVVRLCSCPGILKAFSMKVLSKAQLIQKRQDAHVVSERAVLMSICHPFIVHLHRTFQTKSYLYMLFEYIPGGELFYHLQRDLAFTKSRSQFYAAQLVLILEYLGSMRIAYRDIKPENIMIGANGYLRLIDFGFAMVVAEGGRTFSMCGTPEYQAPEVISGAGHGLKADWWGLGILIHEMLTGATPFCSDVDERYDDRYEIYKSVLTMEVKYPTWCGVETVDLLSKLLLRDPKARLGSDQARHHPFFNGIDWEELYQEKTKASFVPSLESPWDASLFEEYTEEECELPPAGELTPKQQGLFVDF